MLPPPIIPTSWRIESSASRLYVLVFNDPEALAASMSHDHVISATGWTGSVYWDPADPGACEVRIDLPVSGLKADDFGYRARLGYAAMVDDAERAEVRDQMFAESQLNRTEHPSIRYRSTSCVPAGSSVSVTGILTIRGVSQRVVTPMTIRVNRDSLRARGVFQAKASDFGFQPYSALLGAFKNLDRMDFTLDLRGRPG